MSLTSCLRRLCRFRSSALNLQTVGKMAERPLAAWATLLLLTAVQLQVREGEWTFESSAGSGRSLPSGAAICGIFGRIVSFD